MSDEGIPWLKISDATATSGRYIKNIAEKIKEAGRNKSVTVYPDDLVLSNSATPGLPKFIGIEACIHDGWLLLRNFRHISKEYAYYLLLNERSNLVSQGNGSVFTNLKTEILKNHSVKIPDLQTQNAIVETLAAFDNKIELNERMNNTLEGIAQALFKSWFIDFDPVKAKAEGRKPEDMDDDIALLFPNKLESGIPYGWNKGTMEDLFILQRGFDLPQPQRIPGKYPILAASGPSGTHYKYMMKGPGVTTGRSGVLGNVFFIHEDFWPLNTSLFIKEYKNATPSFAYFFLQQIDISAFNAGSAVPTLNRNHIHSLSAVIPKNEVIQQFDKLVMPLFKRQRQNQIQINTLSELRDILIPRLISGKLQVNEISETVEALAL